MDVFSIAIGILGIALAIVFYLRGKATKKPGYISISYPVVSDKFQHERWNLKVTFDDKNVNKLTVTKFLFWNSGNRSIRKEDVPNKFTIIPKSNDTVIFQAYIEQQSGDDFLAATKLDNETNTIEFDFNHLEKNEGFVLAFAHSSDGINDFEVKGKVLDGEEIKMIKKKSGNFAMVIITIISVPTMIGIIDYLEYVKYSIFLTLPIIALMFALMYIIFGIIGIFVTGYPPKIENLFPELKAQK